MGVWGFYAHPSEPPDKPEFTPDYEDMDWWDTMADVASEMDFIEREMSYADAMGQAESIATDEGGWGAWMGGEL